MGTDQNTSTVSSAEEIFQRAKVDYTRIVTNFSDCLCDFDYTSEVTPSDYFNFARLDFRDGHQRGLINALSNVKRCIDCLIENVLRSLGIDPNNISSNAQKFCNEILRGNEKNITPLNLRLFCALGLAPSFLISEIRRLRNKIEHEYAAPELDKVQRALDVSDLLLNNVHSKENLPTVEITDSKRYEEKLDGIWFSSEIEKGVENQPLFVIRTPSGNAQNWLEYHFKGDEYLLYFLFRMTFLPYHDMVLFEETLRAMLQHAGIKTPKEHITIVQQHHRNPM